MTGFVDLFGLDLDGVAVALILAGGFHLESLSHDSFAGDFGGFIHLEVSGVVGVAGNLQFGLLELLGVVVELFLGFRTTLFGQLNFRPAGTLARYSGAGPVEFVGGCGPFCGLVAVGVGVLRSEEFLGVTLL